jgi:predicted Ser/Thr protein kinase
MATELQTGAVVAGFRVLSQLGDGATGAVYLAQDPSGRRVALKLLARELSGDERFRRRFLRETEIAASLAHPHIVPTIVSGADDRTLYLAMAYIDGSDLRELLRRERRLEPQRALALLAQVAAALDAAHHVGLVHRDVKPANILISQEPEGAEHAYVCDFGLARHVSSVGSLTGDRGFVGTIDYVPPEQIEGGDIDSRADVYSLGCVLYECLTGERPFARDSELAVVYAHLNEPPPRITALCRELPGAFDAVFATALAKSPNDRYSTCGALIDGAHAALRGQAVRPRSRRPPLVIAAVAALAALGAAVGGVFATRGGSSAAPQITQTSIAGARLGLGRAAYEKTFGEPGVLVYQQQGGGTGWATLTFPDKKVWVFFPDGITRKASVITTWNEAYKTTAGVGPCSTVADLKAADVKPDKFATTGKVHSAYDVGENLIFATPASPGHPAKVVTAVGLFNGHAPGANRLGGLRASASFVTGNETPACRS